jgi:hypothetical protein
LLPPDRNSDPVVALNRLTVRSGAKKKANIRPGETRALEEINTVARHAAGSSIQSPSYLSMRWNAPPRKLQLQPAAINN